MIISTDGTTRRALLGVVKRRGSADATELAAALGVTTAGVRRHLDALVGDGLLTTSVERRPKGRPATKFWLTPAGDETFPRAYPELTEVLLDAVAEEHGPDAVDRAFARGAAKAAEALRPRLAGQSVAGAAAELAAVQDAAGYLAEATVLDEDSALLTEHNCAIARIAGHYPQACTAELAMLRDAVGEDVAVERVKFMPDGDHTCTYLLRRRTG